ncbi:hypothetical protein [Streptomyces pratensis]|uniref:hypothetical protein n=1 Tax=Streptomyces pratensis TaxID=1169025 RepID=UPI003016C48B
MRRGTEPANALSALQLRRILAWVALGVFVVAAVLFAVSAAAAEPGDSPSATLRAVLAGVCALVAVTAGVDLVVLRRRVRDSAGRGGRRG